MGRLIYTAIASLDGYLADQEGKFDWAEPDDEVFGYINDHERSAGTYLYGRRMYEMMIGWETLDAEPGQTALMIDFAHIWQAADKIVFSATLTEAPTARTTIEPRLTTDRVRELKQSVDHDLVISGPTLAAESIRAGLVDEFNLFAVPAVVGGGLAYLPDGVHLDLDLDLVHRFGNGTLHLRYRPR
ncbi:dihydrofolate reductase family protein [Microlunatus speluncae]|uniref:dihydrofolate reductase family protein n=1 Tax=Microlunatus speluncae TaxID=2594267 RepID=UPI0012665F3C|nr:dihydrofolate reductase family protein [Microlunatus speluncae]